MLTIITKATTAALTTLEAVKADLGIVGDDEDATLSTLIGQASASLLSGIGRSLVRETLRETFRLTQPVVSLVLSRFPVATVDRISVDNGAPLDAGTFELDPAAGMLSRLDAAGRYQRWPAAVVVVDYKAGYLLPGQEGRDLPDDIEGAALALVRRAYHQTGRNPLLKGMDVGGGAIKLDWFVPTANAGGMPPEVAAVVERYSQPTIG